jgi:hypothetical protein
VRIKTSVPKLLIVSVKINSVLRVFPVRLSVVFVLVGSMLTLAIAPVNASGGGGSYSNPSAPIIVSAFSIGSTYINFRQSSSDGGSPTLTYSVTAYPEVGSGFQVEFTSWGCNQNDGITDICQIEILGLSSETTYSFSMSANNGFFDSNNSVRSVEITTPPGGWFHCESGDRNIDQNSPLQSYLIELGIVVENTDCDGAVEIRPGTLGIYGGFINSAITSVTIPESVVELDEAFKNSVLLSQVTFLGNSQLYDIGDSSFQGTALERITIPSSVESIGEYAFSGAASLSSINIPSSVGAIRANTFSSATSLSSITIPSNVRVIGESAFFGASSLSSVVFDSNSQLEEIGESAFGSTSLTSIRIPAGVTLIGNYAFEEATALASVYFLGNAPDTGENSFDVVASEARAFIQPLASGFEIDAQGKWKGLIIAAENSASLYRNWQTPLTSIANGPRVGDRIFASAFERALPRTLFREDIIQDTDDDPVDNYRTNEDDYPTPEEYVYRITKEPNEPASSVDHQPHALYEALTIGEQSQWYVDADLGGPNYQFSWNAFMCVSETNGALRVNKPTGFNYSYASREDGILLDESFSSLYNLFFKNAAIDWIIASSWQTVRSAVGTKHNNSPYTQAFLGDSDGIWNSFIWGILEINASCGVGETLEALQIVVDQNTPITTKDFLIPETFNLLYVGNPINNVPSEGITIGVTGAAALPPSYNAALWGLTTIADSSPPLPPAPPAPPSSLPNASDAAAAAKRAADQQELVNILALIPSLGSIALNLGKTTKALTLQKCVKKKQLRFVKKGAKCPKGFVRKR